MIFFFFPPVNMARFLGHSQAGQSLVSTGLMMRGGHILGTGIATRGLDCAGKVPCVSDAWLRAGAGAWGYVLRPWPPAWFRKDLRCGERLRF